MGKIAVLLIMMFLLGLTISVIVHHYSNRKNYLYLTDYYYRHYKGGYYRMVCKSTMQTAGQEGVKLITYMALIDNTLHTRTSEEFFGTVEVNGITKRRFEQVHGYGTMFERVG